MKDGGERKEKKSVTVGEGNIEIIIGLGNSVFCGITVHARPGVNFRSKTESPVRSGPKKEEKKETSKIESQAKKRKLDAANRNARQKQRSSPDKKPKEQR